MVKTIDLERLRILIVEDRSDARNMISAMLSQLGVNQIFEASDGMEGFRFMDMADDFVDLIICDWNMPEMTGVELLRQLRSVNSRIPFLMITGRSDAESVFEAKNAGVTAYIRKPFSLAQLEAKLRIICQRIAA